MIVKGNSFSAAKKRKQLIWAGIKFAG